MGKNLVGIIFLVLIVINIVKQMSILTMAKAKNLEMKNKLTYLEVENRKLKQQVEYATSSAFIDQQVRDKFGLGDKNDNWLIVSDEQNYNLWDQADSGNPDSPLRQWISLFTR